jgi:hypothetical protein
MRALIYSVVKIAIICKVERGKRMPEIDREEIRRKDTATRWMTNNLAEKQNCAQWLNLRDHHTKMLSGLELAQGRPLDDQQPS